MFARTQVERTALLDDLAALIGPDEPARIFEAARHGMRARELAECSLGGVVALVTLAWADSLVRDFPGEARIDSEGGANAGLTARRDHGMWRLHGEVGAYRNAVSTQPVNGLGHPAETVVLVALGVPATAATRAHVRDLLDWGSVPGAVGKVVSGIAGRIPEHALIASVGHLTGLFAALGRTLTEQDAFDWALAVRRRPGSRPGARPDDAPTQGMPTALAHACARGDRMLAEGLLAAGVRPDMTDGAGRTALMVAAGNVDLPLVGALLRHGAKAGRRDHEGATALHALAEAAAAGSSEEAFPVLESLLAAGADTAALRRDGETASSILASALEDARSSPHPCIVHGTAKILETLVRRLAEVSSAQARREAPPT